jgi:hypothetical protein
MRSGFVRKSTQKSALCAMCIKSREKSAKNSTWYLGLFLELLLKKLAVCDKIIVGGCTEGMA